MAHEDRLYYFDELIDQDQDMVGGRLVGGASFRDYVNLRTGDILPGQQLALQQLLKRIKTSEEVKHSEGFSTAILNLWHALHPEAPDNRHARARKVVSDIRAKLLDDGQQLVGAPYASSNAALARPIAIVPKVQQQVRVLRQDVPESIRAYATRNGIDAVTLWNSADNRDSEEGWQDNTPAFFESRKIFTDARGRRYADPYERYQYRPKPASVRVAAGMKRGSGVCSSKSTVAPDSEEQAQAQEREQKASDKLKVANTLAKQKEEKKQANLRGISVEEYRELIEDEEKESVSPKAKAELEKQKAENRKLKAAKKAAKKAEEKKAIKAAVKAALDAAKRAAAAISSRKNSVQRWRDPAGGRDDY